MKKILSLFIIISLFMILTSCIPDFNVIKYTEEEVLEIAKEKYNIKEFYYTDLEVKIINDKLSQISYDNYYCNGIFTKIINPDNLEKALSSFAGKREYNKKYSFDFVCYLALGITEDNKSLFVYYNTTINKNQNIIDTIGSSEYPYDVKLEEINLNFIEEIELTSLRNNLKKEFNAKINIKNIFYHFDKPTFISLPYYSKEATMIQLYKENNSIVYDIFEIEKNGSFEYNNIQNILISKELIYSTSNNYEVHFNKLDENVNDYFDLKYTVEQSKEADYLDLISGTITLKDIGKEVVYYSFSYKIVHKIKIDNGELIDYESIEHCTELRNNRFGLLIDKIENHDHKETTKVEIISFLIIYKK